MVFSSVPLYLDPPNWNQLQPSHPPVPAAGGVSGGVGVDAHQLQPPPAPPRPDGNAGGSAARPGSMADRARLARVPQPEPGLKCPRCESTNTKFCYFNNYSLSQPRHFCKTCRRYWTRGGALRNVPVGGGCRRNKRSKSSSGSSKSSANATAAADHHQVGTSASSATSGATAGALSSNNPQAPPQLPFMASLHPLSDYAAAANIRLNLGGMQPLDTVDFQVPSVGLEQWRLQQVQHQFPFMAGLEPAPVAPSSVGLFPFDGTEGGVADGVLGSLSGHVHGKPSASGLITQLASVKMEEHNPHELTLSRQYLGIPGNDQYWVGGGGSTGGGSSSGGRWTDLSGFNPSSTSNIL